MKEKRKLNVRRVLIGIIIVPLILAAAPIAALAADFDVADGQTLDLATGQLTWTEGGALIDTYAINEGDTIKIAPGAAAWIKGAKNVMIACGAGAALTIENVAIDLGATADACALSFTGGSNTLKLSGTSSLKSGTNEPGVRVEEGTALEVTGDGAITATGGEDAAGIGGGIEESGGTITITAGMVTAQGGFDGAGIGGGYKGSGGVIAVTGGILNATGGGDGGAGIGSGDGENESLGFNGGNITITGGTVTATGAEYGAGIGGGDYCAGGTITIKGSATVTATGDDDGAGIGGGYRGAGGTITIGGDAQVTATGGYNGAGIGGGDYCAGGTTIIEGNAKITATGGDDAAGIGGGYQAMGGTIKITGGTVTATGGGDGGAGIGSGSSSYENPGTNDITITGGTVVATGAEYSAGIGGGSGGSGGTITIGGDATITATGAKNAAGIGGGDNGDGGVITIEGNPTVTATGGEKGAGIGGGYKGNGGGVNISSGVVYAIKDPAGSFDIGQGIDGVPGTIKISGSAALLLGTDTTSPTAPQAPAHTHYEYNTPQSEVYGIAVPSGWAPPFGAYLAVYEISYDANGGSGSAPAPEEKAAPAKAEAAQNPFTYADHDFTGWNTKADGSGTDYTPGETFAVTGNTTLYAQWYAPVQSISLDKHSLTMATGATYQLTATIVPDGTGAAIAWTSSNEEVATVDNGVVKAVKAGSATITAKAEEKSDSCAVTVTGPRPGPTPKPAPSPTAGIEAEEKKAEVIIEEVIIEKEVEAAPSKSPMQEDDEEEQDGERVWVTIQTAGLPASTAAVLLADGRIIELTGADETDIEIDTIYVPKGIMQMIPLDGANRALGVYTMDGQAIVLPEAESESAWEDVAIWLIVVLAGAGVAIYLLWRRVRQR